MDLNKLEMELLHKLRGIDLSEDDRQRLMMLDHGLLLEAIQRFEKYAADKTIERPYPYIKKAYETVAERKKNLESSIAASLGSDDANKPRQWVIYLENHKPGRAHYIRRKRVGISFDGTKPEGAEWQNTCDTARNHPEYRRPETPEEATNTIMAFLESPRSDKAKEFFGTRELLQMASTFLKGVEKEYYGDVEGAAKLKQASLPFSPATAAGPIRYKDDDIRQPYTTRDTEFTDINDTLSFGDI